MKASELLKGDVLLADRTRLAIMSLLAVTKNPIEFLSLIEELELTKGNLSAHTRRLEEAGYLKVTKEFVDRKSRTTFLATNKGRQAVKDHLANLEKIMHWLQRKK